MLAVRLLHLLDVDEGLTTRSSEDESPQADNLLGRADSSDRRNTAGVAIADEGDLLVLGLVVSQVAGHLNRQLWKHLLGHGEHTKAVGLRDEAPLGLLNLLVLLAYELLLSLDVLLDLVIEQVQRLLLVVADALKLTEEAFDGFGRRHAHVAPLALV